MPPWQVFGHAKFPSPIAAAWVTRFGRFGLYRYIWDGAVVCHGFSPYRFSPESVAVTDDAVGSLAANSWSPLVLKEFANSGHLDSIAVFLMVAVVACLSTSFFLPAVLLLIAGLSVFQRRVFLP